MVPLNQNLRNLRRTNLIHPGGTNPILTPYQNRQCDEQVGGVSKLAEFSFRFGSARKPPYHQASPQAADEGAWTFKPISKPDKKYGGDISPNGDANSRNFKPADGFGHIARVEQLSAEHCLFGGNDLVSCTPLNPLPDLRSRKRTAIRLGGRWRTVTMVKTMR